jgi:flagellar biosynthesis/type III secretory pathway protein FliH
MCGTAKPFQKQATGRSMMLRGEIGKELFGIIRVFVDEKTTTSLVARLLDKVEEMVEQEAEQARSDGHDDGYDEGHDDGYQKGYDDGFQDGERND